MGIGSVWHWVIVALVVLVLFGKGRVSDVMGEFGKGIKSFKDGMADETANNSGNRPVTPPPSQIAPPNSTASAQPTLNGEAVPESPRQP